MNPLLKKEIYLCAPGLKTSILCALIFPFAITFYFSDPQLGASFDTVIAQLMLSGWIFGLIWLVASVFGAEFQYGTMGELLCQPIPRACIWKRKLFAITPWGLLALLILLVTYLTKLIGYKDLLFFAAIIVTAFSFTPLLTLLPRNPIAGTMFSFAVALLIFQIIDLFALKGETGEQIHQLILLTTIIMSFPVLAFGKRLFTRLEVANSGGRQISFRLNVFQRRQPQSWQGALIWKEIHCHRFSIMLGVLLAATAIILALIGWQFTASSVAKNRFEVGVVAACLLLMWLFPMVAGIAAIAEEKSSGTQVLDITLPKSNIAKWNRKLAVALTVTFLFSFAFLVTFGVILQNIGFPSLGLQEFKFLLCIISFSFMSGLFAAAWSSNSIKAFSLALTINLAGLFGILVPLRSWIFGHEWLFTIIFLTTLWLLHDAAFRLYHTPNQTR